MTSRFKSIYDFARELGFELANKALELKSQRLRKSWVTPTNFSTHVDKELDILARTRIGNKFPNHGIISEEGDAYQEKSDYVWVIDSLDGTIQYAYDIFPGHWGISIGVMENGNPIIGAIILPEYEGGKVFSSIAGHGTFASSIFNNQPEYQLPQRTPKQLKESIICFDFGKIGRQEPLPLMNQLLDKDTGCLYIMTTACTIASVANMLRGKVAGYVHYNAEWWDIAASIVILQEAGFSVFYQKSQNNDLYQIVATEPHLFEDIMMQFHSC